MCSAVGCSQSYESLVGNIGAWASGIIRADAEADRIIKSMVAPVAKRGNVHAIILLGYSHR